MRVEGARGGGDPLDPPSPLSHSSNASEHSSKKTSHSHDLPLLKLDVKFEFPVYDGELNEEKLDNWIK